MRVQHKGVPRLTVSSRVIGLVKGSRQPSGTNVFGGVDVSVVAGLTTRTVPRPHRQRLALGDVAALRTTFCGREPAVDFDDGAACFVGLILDHTNERRPSRVANRPGKTSILLHSLHVQALQSDDLVLVNDLAGELVKKVFSFVFDLGVDPRYASLLLLPVLRPFLFARKTTLCLLKPVEAVFQVFWIARLPTVGGDNDVGYAKIDADRFPVAVFVGDSWLRLWVRHRASDTDEIPSY